MEDVVDDLGVLELLGEDVRLGLEESEAELDGVSNVAKNLKESKEINMLFKQSLLQTKKSGKAGAESGKNKGKKPAARGSKAKNKKNS